jgi:D-inositol-3-phosphate glycosyltransferase
MRSLAVLSMHTSPLAQPGTGDGGGMNVYVRELSSSLARSGVECEVFTRAWSPSLAATVTVEPGLRVHHVPAGPVAPVPKDALPGLVGEFAEGVMARLESLTWGGASDGPPVDAIHANYWLSGVAGHEIKHRLNLPLVCTFHTLDRVKAEADPDELGEAGPAKRAEAEAAVIGCSDAILASCSAEAAQIAELYGADPSRIEIVAPGVDHAFFAPGDRSQARRALGLPESLPMLLFVGRIQPLKEAGIAIRALSELDRRSGAFLVIVGGPSGPHGETELKRLHRLVEALDLTRRVVFSDAQPHELLSTYYRAADVCVVPSRSESFGLVALEAGACGAPVVAAAVGGLRTIVEHGSTGYLVNERDPAAFATPVAELLANPSLALRFGQKAAHRARAYTWSEAGRGLRRLYARLTEVDLVTC